MDRDEWKRIDEIFEAALGRPLEDRPRFLAEACAGESTLLQAVESLLRHEERAEGFMEVPAAVMAVSEQALGPDPRDLRSGAVIGEIIGPYRVEREIARGGMASVYLGVRVDEEFERRVALKLLQPGMTTDYLLKRFLSERQILASLDHPNIAHLFEGGTTDDGRPYLVMEYIDGMAIDVYCDEHELSVHQRVELFRKVCSAVHCAHQNLVVHRDIKPSNVLVGGDGEPRLLDFGIAKLLDPEAFPLTLEATAPGQQPMTPNYASPEQVRGEPTTTACDIYSLGVLLYKLLTGGLPHRFTHLSLREIEYVLEKEETPKPSTAVARKNAETPSRLAASPQQLRRQLAGDLDNIVLMALRAEPGRRYGSVQHLSQDLQRYLTGRPVLAREDTLAYHLSKFLRRHRLAVAAAGLVLALIVAFAAAMAWQAAETARQRDSAQQERDRAEQVSEFLVDVFQDLDPWRAPGTSLSVREVLDQGADKIDQELAGQPDVRATLQNAIGSVYLRLGHLDQAAPLLEEALETREALLGPDRLEVAESLLHVASLYRAQGKYELVEPLFERSLAIREEHLGREHPEVARVLIEMMIHHRQRGRYAVAEELGRQALELFEASLGSEHLEIAGALNALAGVLNYQGKTAEAEEHLREALAMMERLIGEPHMRTGALLVNLAGVRFHRGDREETRALLERALAVYGAILPEDHPTLADTLIIMSYVQDEAAEAERDLRRALEIYQQSLGDEHPSVANGLYELGDLLLREGRLAEAEPLLLRAVALREAAVERDHPMIAESLRGLADLRMKQGELARAEQLYLRALAIWEKHPHHQFTRGIPQAYASLLRATGRAEAAAELEARVSAAAGMN